MTSRIESLKHATMFCIFLHFIIANNHFCWHFRDCTVGLLSAPPANRRLVKMSLQKRRGCTVTNFSQ